MKTTMIRFLITFLTIMTGVSVSAQIARTLHEDKDIYLRRGSGTSVDPGGTNDGDFCNTPTYVAPYSNCTWVQSHCKWFCGPNFVAQDGFNTLEMTHSLNIGPNPFISEINIRSEEKGDMERKVTIYSLTGEIVYQSNIGRVHRINTSRFSNGIYILELIDDHMIYRENILKID